MNSTKEIMECTDTDVPGRYWSALLGMTITQTRITSIAKSKFKAESISKKIDGKTVRCLRFNEKHLDKFRSSYHVPGRIEIITKSEKESKNEIVTSVTSVTPPRSLLPIYDDIMTTKISAIYLDLFVTPDKNE